MGNLNGCAGTLIALMMTLTLGMVGGILGWRSPEVNQSEYAFVLDEAGAQYSFANTFNCQFEIVGEVSFLDDTPVDRENIVIKMLPLGTYDDRPAANAYLDRDFHYGLIIVGNYWYRVWVHDLAADVPLSEEILVDDLNCAEERIVATLNFVQVADF